jgi:hypothetical protein
LETVIYLLNNEADLTILDNKGNDPLKDAIREYRHDVIEYLNLHHPEIK